MNRELIIEYLNSSCAKGEDLKNILDQYKQKSKDFMIECLLQLESDNLDKLEQVLDDSYPLRVMLTDILHELSDRDHLFYLICNYITTWNLFNKILEFEDEKEELIVDIQQILVNEPAASKVLRYLYNNPTVEYSKIKKAFEPNINSETLDNILNKISDKNIAYRMSIQDYTVYDLTENSRRWVEKNIENCVNKTWTVGKLALENGSSYSPFMVEPVNLDISRMEENKFGRSSKISNVYVAKIQPQGILKFTSKSNINFQTALRNKFNTESNAQFENSLGKGGKHGEFEMAGLSKGIK